jgi:nonsense-mediated mRNA decay protein 3
VKVKLTVQKEVAQGAILQQTFIVEFTIFNQICDDCQRIEAKDYWKALVQVRQRVRFYLFLFNSNKKISSSRLHIKKRSSISNNFYLNIMLMPMHRISNKLMVV